ncbi:response regulator [Actinocrispum wychmicini]|uniref:Transcriptional regulatory protein KdpE n=1 Tax=Actinocrispum wychmicini TaxID=1213861 RepID=A0A4R2J747_9PSEU|nr:response regulator [Actinocrispum wychmicini]TCO54891.1 two-component system KDP operon response regulator KdpE [Actinocrispum wychmicini]
MTRILVVEDETQIATALRINLVARGYQVITVHDGRSALTAAADSAPDAVLLDLILPDIDGTQVITALRGWTHIPIIVLSARTDASSKIGALDAGADDYVTKPFGMDELMARVRAALRRANAGQHVEEDLVVDTESFTVNLAAKKIRRGSTEVHLTPTEWAILEMLIRHQGRLVTQRQLLEAVWGPDHVHHAHYLRVYVGQLRKKLEENPAEPRHFITEPGTGYRFQPTYR